jgi:nucleoside-diphosphate-sugar epimerase
MTGDQAPGTVADFVYFPRSRCFFGRCGSFRDGFGGNSGPVVYEPAGIGAAAIWRIKVASGQATAKVDAAVRERRQAVEVWGTGRPRREFLHVDDLADAVVFLMKTWSDEEPVNIGTGTDVTIAALARLIAEIVGFTGRFVFDPSKPDGAPRKLLDVSKLTAAGWRPQIDLEAGIRQTYDWYRTAHAVPAK